MPFLQITAFPPVRATIVAAMLVALAVPADAQQAPPNDSNIFLDAPGLLVKKPKPGPPDVKPQPTVWPRLDPGAVFCRSADDLRRLAARRGGEPVSGPVDCQIIREPTGISIVRRESAGMVEVQTTDPRAGGLGWTDAWLPSKEPPGRSQASATR